MKPNKQLILMAIALLTFCGSSFAQTTHVVTLHVDTDELNNGNNKKAFSFSASQGTVVENIDNPETFTILVNEDDEIEIVDDMSKPNKEKIFKNKKTKGVHKNGKKKVKAKVKKKSKGNEYKYIIRFTIGQSDFEIDPGIKVGQ